MKHVLVYKIKSSNIVNKSKKGLLCVTKNFRFNRYVNKFLQLALRNINITSILY